MGGDDVDADVGARTSVSSSPAIQDSGKGNARATSSSGRASATRSPCSGLRHEVKLDDVD